MGILSRIFKKTAPVLPPLIPNYKELCKSIHINDNRLIMLAVLRDKYKKTMSRYQKVSELCHGFPIDLLFALHYREADLDFTTCLHNGDPLPGPTKHVPKGRGPFASWEDGAVDALMMESHNFPQVWTFEERLAFAEKYNGIGYRGHQVYSPYVFAGTNVYKSGLYTSDGSFNSTKIDERVGVAAILLEINA